ncbi:MAG: glycine--tRNA ligase subunit beta [Candidatus Dasytiphilus stammeri]
MIQKKNFLVEIGTEELPSKDLHNIAVTFTTNVIKELRSLNLEYNKIHWFASPRRLAIKIDGLNDFELTKKILPDLVNKALLQLVKKKFPAMRWGKENRKFIRPVHSVLLLFGDELLSTQLLFGIQSSRKILGHRFMGELQVKIDYADEYPEILLSRGKVIACYEERKRTITFQVKKVATELGGKVKIDNLLLEELTSLVEWPVVLMGSFDKKFLSLPILTHIIEYHHKSFLVYNSNDQLMPKFIFIANIESQHPQKIIEGNENFLHSRLSDARFFLNEDRKKRLHEYFSLLKQIIFQHQLGTLCDKVQRIQKLAIYIAEKINININYVERAALLAKCDLATNMVFEFPNTQGIIGMHYALLDGEKKEIAISIKEHYHPSYKNDILPSNLIACTIAIADKLDTLTGIIGIGIHSTGDRDPFGLRRNTLGILRIILEKHLPLNLQFLIQESIKFYNNQLTNITVTNDVMQFFFKRLVSWYQEKGYRIDIIKAVSAVSNLSLLSDFDARIKALSSFKDSFQLTMINKRIANFLRKNQKDLSNLNEDIDLSLLIYNEEKKLASCIMHLSIKIPQYYGDPNYYELVLKELIKLSDPVNDFFKFVPINIYDNKLKINRLKFLIKLQKIFFIIADFSLLQS